MTDLNQNQEMWIKNEVERIRQISSYTQLSVDDVLHNINLSFKSDHVVTEENLPDMILHINSLTDKVEELKNVVAQLEDEKSKKEVYLNNIVKKLTKEKEDSEKNFTDEESNLLKLVENLEKEKKELENKNEEHKKALLSLNSEDKDKDIVKEQEDENQSKIDLVAKIKLVEPDFKHNNMKKSELEEYLKTLNANQK